MLKSVNTPMQKNNNATLMMDFLRYKKKEEDQNIFCNLPGASKSINKWTSRLC